jgi:hypothetical protein
LYSFSFAFVSQLIPEQALVGDEINVRMGVVVDFLCFAVIYLFGEGEDFGVGIFFEEVPGYLVYAFLFFGCCLLFLMDFCECCQSHFH